MITIASIVDWDALLKTAWASLAAGVGVTFAFSVSIYGAARTMELRRDVRLLAATLAAALMVLGLAACVAALVLGVVVMTSK
jgi:uncharacterized membrane protein